MYGVVAAVMKDFEIEWKRAEEVTQVQINDMLSNDKKREEKKREKSRSQSVTREASRSLSVPLSKVAEEK